MHDSMLLGALNLLLFTHRSDAANNGIISSKSVDDDTKMRIFMYAYPPTEPTIATLWLVMTMSNKCQ